VSTAIDRLHFALHVTTRVQSGNRVEITAPELREGQDVDVFVIPRGGEGQVRISPLELLDRLPPGPRSASTWEEIDRRFHEERDAWDH
jgi:hypothetical protein